MSVEHEDHRTLRKIYDAIKRNATKLDLSSDGIKILPSEIGLIEGLEILILDSNPITAFPPEIGKLKNLQILSARSCELTSLPQELWSLEKLETLRLGGNQIEVIAGEIKNLSNLRHLSLWGNPLGKISDEIFSLSLLRIFNISQMGLKFLPDKIGNLYQLEVLGIDGNEISELGHSIRTLVNLEELYAYDNPLPIPPEILGKVKEPKAIIEYYFSINKTKQVLGGAKILVVGESTVGKTSIIDRIVGRPFKSDQEKTNGISISQWVVDEVGDQNIIENTQASPLKDSPKIQLNIWDFGGQEIMHATHQFFLTKRSLYLLVLDSRISQEQNKVEYWLKLIQSFGGESPVLIVSNKADQHPLDINRTGLREKYSNIVDIIETSAATGAGIESLQTAITEQVNKLPHVHDLLPEAWFKIKTQLEALGHASNFITHDKYIDLCVKNQVRDEVSQHTLIGFLHDLGVVLHFQDEPRLEELGILNPQWAANGVYKILNSHTLFQNNGVLDRVLLDEILNFPEYPANKRLFIVDMMRKFELCYDIEPDKIFLIPDLLSKEEPYTGKWNGALAFQYHYNILPTSIISRFTVRMNAYIHQKTVWRFGVVLKKGGNMALVKADIEDRKIYIWVDGDQPTRRDFLSAIRTEFEAMHKPLIKIEATEKVPHPMYPELILDFSELLQFERDDIDEFPKSVDRKTIMVSVRELLNGVGRGSARLRGNRETHIHIGQDFTGNLIVGNKNEIKDIHKLDGD